MRNFRPTLAAAAVALALSTGAQAQNAAYIFGDSLSDAGQYGSRFTTNPGLTFPMYVAQHFGITVTPSFQGGTDYGQGGAHVNSPSPLIPPGVPNLSIADQVTQFLAHGAANPNALYQIQGGGDDLLTLVDKYAHGQIGIAGVQAGLAQAAVDLAAQAARLQAAGARYLIVYNLGDGGKTPYGIASGASSTLTQLSQLFNATLNSAIGAAKLQVIQVNQFQLMQEIAANPAAFGFENVTGLACTTADALQCTPATLVTPNAAQTYQWATDVHPTTGFALIAAQAAVSMIEAPIYMSVLPEAPLGVEAANFRTVDSRMMSGANSSRPMKKYEFWAAYDYSKNDFNSGIIGGDARLNTLTAGGDIKLSEKLIMGGFFGYTENKGNFGNDAGNYTLKETSGTFYTGYGDGPWYVGATLGAGDLDYSNITRNIQLGTLKRTETGNTGGWHLMASVLGGYWFNTSGEIQHGPWGRLAYQKIRVNQFYEQGSDSTALGYGEQNRDSLIGSIGWQATGQIGMFRPFGRITWDWESKTDQQQVSATPVGLNGTYTIPGFKPDSSWVQYTLGASADFGNVTGFLTANGTSGKSDGNYFAVTVGMRIPL